MKKNSKDPKLLTKVLEGKEPKKLSNRTILFQAPAHEKGGQDIRFGDRVVEIEGGETGHIDSQGDLVIGGNLKNIFTGRLFKNDFRKIAKEEAKIEKQINKIDEEILNISPNSKFDALKLDTLALNKKIKQGELEEIEANKEFFSIVQETTKNIKEIFSEPSNGEYRTGGKVSTKDLIVRYVTKASRELGFDPEVAVNLMLAESSGTIPKTKNNKGAYGFAQFLPTTAEKYGVTIENLTSTKEEDIRKVAFAMVSHLKDLVKENRGDLVKTIMSYNGGSGMFDKIKDFPSWKEYARKNNIDYSDMSKVPGEVFQDYFNERYEKDPKKSGHAYHVETRNYVNNILGEDYFNSGRTKRNPLTETMNKNPYEKLDKKIKLDFEKENVLHRLERDIASSPQINERKAGVLGQIFQQQVNRLEEDVTKPLYLTSTGRVLQDGGTIGRTPPEVKGREEEYNRYLELYNGDEDKALMSFRAGYDIIGNMESLKGFNDYFGGLSVEAIPGSEIAKFLELNVESSGKDLNIPELTKGIIKPFEVTSSRYEPMEKVGGVPLTTDFRRPDYTPPTFEQVNKPVQEPRTSGLNRWLDTIDRSPNLSGDSRVRLSDIAPELNAVFSQPSYVQGQRANPIFNRDYQVTFQDRINDNLSVFNRMSQSLAGNPEALSVLAGQMYRSNSGVRGDEFRTNQSLMNTVYNQNLNELRRVDQMNLGLADQQFVRQEQAKENTRQDRLAGIRSIQSKYDQNRLFNQQKRMLESELDYVLDRDGNLVFREREDTKNLDLREEHLGLERVDNPPRTRRQRNVFGSVINNIFRNR